MPNSAEQDLQVWEFEDVSMLMLVVGLSHLSHFRCSSSFRRAFGEVARLG
jgi:AraC-like DNA-binding protein